jgi:hypothetical protein
MVQQNQERVVYQGFWRKWDQTSDFPEMAGKALKLHFGFDTEAGDVIQVKMIAPRRAGDMVQSMLAHFDQSPWKMLPIWSHHGQENWCMIGYHAVCVIADAWMKGIRTFDGAKAFEAMKTTATTPGYDGLADYMKLGWVADDGHSSSASKTLEYAYDDWAIAQMAGDLGRKGDAAEFLRRAASSRNLWDAKTGFMRARRRDGRWREPFDALQPHDQGYIEGNAWNYSLYMPHDAAWLVKQMGGGGAFARHLEELFTTHLDDRFFADTEDLSRVSMLGRVRGGWAGQMIGVAYGAPTEFQCLGKINESETRFVSSSVLMLMPDPRGAKSSWKGPWSMKVGSRS